MNEVGRTHLAVAAGVTSFAVVYLCAAFLEWPLLTYDPEAGVWRFVAHAPTSAIPYYGLVLWGAVAGVDGAVVTYLALGSVPGPTQSRPLGALAAGWALTSLLLAAAYFAFRATT